MIRAIVKEGQRTCSICRSTANIGVVLYIREAAFSVCRECLDRRLLRTLTRASDTLRNRKP